jgi:ABC-type Fe2+-enterobactin transport system substrate-binding protein
MGGDGPMTRMVPVSSELTGTMLVTGPPLIASRAPGQPFTESDSAPDRFA